MESENSQSKKNAEVSELENIDNKNSQEMDQQTKSDSPELNENNRMNIPELEKTDANKISDLAGDTSDLERRIIRNTSELKKRMKRNSSSDAEKKTNTNTTQSDNTRDVSELKEEMLSKVAVELDKGKGASDSEKRNETFTSKSHGDGNAPDEAVDKVDETDVPLLVGDSISIEMKGGPEGKPTVHVHAKKSKEAAAKKKVSMNPIQRLKHAWNTSSNVCTFFLKATIIIFATLGWMMCAGGIPFVSIAMIAIGSLYFDDCNVQPNIPLYLVVGGVCGTVQHVIAFWNKYLPEKSQGRLSVYRRWYSLIDGAMTLFLFIWFILGCVWVYGVKEVEFQDDYKDEYCHKTLYYFAFWLLNFSFIIIATVMVLGLCAILFIVALPKEEAVV